MEVEWKDLVPGNAGEGLRPDRQTSLQQALTPHLYLSGILAQMRSKHMVMTRSTHAAPRASEPAALTSAATGGGVIEGGL